jgi:6,7-dimethyl-8-ribityllumazine synthase
MKKKILIVDSHYYKDITKNLILNTKQACLTNNFKINIIKIPGVFEIPVVISKNINKYDGFIALGCVIKGQTPHFDFICLSTFNALINLSIKSKKPMGNGIITCLNIDQAKKRSKKKGQEAFNAVAEVLKNVSNRK